MPSTSFRRVGLDATTNLDHVTSTILSAAAAPSRLAAQLESDGLSGVKEEALCREILSRWSKGVHGILKDNVTIKGASWKSAMKRGRDEYEAVDPQRQTKVANLSQTIDTRMEEAVLNRKELPLRLEEAVKARMEVLEDARARMQALRVKSLQESERALDNDEQSDTLPFEEHAEELSRTLPVAVQRAELLAANLPKQPQAVREQQELVEQLRNMPA